MNKLPNRLSLLLVAIPGITAAVTLEDYVKACTGNQGNGMGPELCECVGNETQRLYGPDGLAYMYYVASKQSAKMHQVMAGMDQQQKMGIMMHTMKAPSECAGKLAREEQQQTPRDTSATREAVAGPVADTASEAGQ